MRNISQNKIITFVVLSSLTLSSFLFAKGTGAMVASSLFGDLASDDGSRSRGLSLKYKSNKRRKLKDPTPILKRNMFDSITGPVDKLPVVEKVIEEEPTEPEVLEDPNAELENCGDDFRLVALVSLPEGIEGSFASIGQKKEDALVYFKGDWLSEEEDSGPQIEAIQWYRVILRQEEGGFCELVMFEDEEERKKKTSSLATTKIASTKTKDKRRKASDLGRNGGLSEEEMNEGIEKVSSTKFNVKKTLLDKVLSNQGELMRAARVVPYKRDGEVVGVRMFGIRRKSLLGKLGLRNADILRTINGYDMSRPDTALEAYAKLRNAENLTVSIERRGQPVNVEYNIQ